MKLLSGTTVHKESGKNDIAWRKIFDKYAILHTIDRDGFFYISADHIREFREPRLMAKFDHQINLPHIFSHNSLSILPIGRGHYCISHFTAYQPCESTAQQVRHLALSDNIQSINPAHITSEAVALNCALAAGMFSDFLAEEHLSPTVCGRMGSGEFSFSIWNTRRAELFPLTVNNAQIEIDIALESPSCLYLVEAKRDIASDFLIRQLYYPLRTWMQRLRKSIRTLFFVYSNSIFSLYEYVFDDANRYDSIRLAKHALYAVEDTRITRDDIEGLLRRVTLIEEPADIPFPQADSFPRLLNLCELLQERPLSRDEITEHYAFNIRQTRYYTDAGCYLGLIERIYNFSEKRYTLSEMGRYIVLLPYKKRQIALCECILRHKIFFNIFQISLQEGTVPDKSRIAVTMKTCSGEVKYSETTYLRRASTIASWIHWIISRTNDAEASSPSKNPNPDCCTHLSLL